MVDCDKLGWIFWVTFICTLITRDNFQFVIAKLILQLSMAHSGASDFMYERLNVWLINLLHPLWRLLAGEGNPVL